MKLPTIDPTTSHSEPLGSVEDLFAQVVELLNIHLSQQSHKPNHEKGRAWHCLKLSGVYTHVKKHEVPSHFANSLA